MDNNSIISINIVKSGDYNILISSNKIIKSISIEDKNLYGELCIKIRSILEELYEDPKCKNYRNFKWKAENKNAIALIEIIMIDSDQTSFKFLYKNDKNCSNSTKYNFYHSCDIVWRDDLSIYEVLNNLDKII